MVQILRFKVAVCKSLATVVPMMLFLVIYYSGAIVLVDFVCDMQYMLG